MEERNKKIKRKVIAILIVIDLIFLTMFLIAVPKEHKEYDFLILIVIGVVGITYLIMTIFINVSLFKVLTDMFYKEDYKESIKVLKYLFIANEYLEVIPIKADKYEEFILGLVDKAKFIASSNENDEVIKIKVKIGDEEDYRFLEEINIENFNCYYILKDEQI